MTFQLILDEIKKNIKKILNDLSISNVNFSVEAAKPGFGDITCCPGEAVFSGDSASLASLCPRRTLDTSYLPPASQPSNALSVEVQISRIVHDCANCRCSR